jgi:hypothetical protein
MSDSLYYWGGRRRLENPILRRKRVISTFDGEQPVYCPWDVRRWILPGNDSYMVEVWQEIAEAHWTTEKTEFTETDFTG